MAHTQNLDKWFGGSQWRMILQQHSSGLKCDEELIKYYRQQLISISGGRLEFTKDYPFRSIDGQVKYHLVFASGDRLGMKLMSDILYKAEAQYRADQEVYRQQSASSYSQLNMFDDPNFDPSIQL